MNNGSKGTAWTTWLRHGLELPWAEMILAVFCFHCALAIASLVARIVLAMVGVVLLAKAIGEIIEKRKSTRS